jgi:transcriptional repressor NrdR
MRCPFCHLDNDKVGDTRTSTDGFVVRRRRTCCGCNRKFTTYERVEITQIRVIKRDGSRVPFDREKLRQGLERACWKRQISDTQISTLITQVERDIDSAFETEVASQFIGERVIQYLAELDQVAYVRFASVYRHFKDADDFIRELQKMRQNLNLTWSAPEQPQQQKKTRFSKPKKKQGQ